MSLRALIIPSSPADLLLHVLSLTALALLFRFVHRISPFHPLYRIPGPLIPRLTSLWLNYHSWYGDEATTVHRLHQRYGPIVRIGPSAVDIADAGALHDIYVNKGGMRKPDFYLNFIVDGYRTIFSETIPERRVDAAKAVIGLFSRTNLNKQREYIQDVVERWVDVLRLESEKSRRSGRHVDVLAIGRSLAADAVTGYLFGKEMGVLQRQKMMAMDNARNGRADGMIDAFDAIGRYWYLPPWLHGRLDSWRLYFAQNREEIYETFNIMENFAEEIVEAAVVDEKDSMKGTYQDRLLALGTGKDEVKAQVKDALFAGVDTTGLNLAVIIWNLVRYPNTYQALKQEVQSRQLVDEDPQVFPYLRAIVQEGLRISNANPTRFPRVVPAEGWQFQDYSFPAGTEVSCSPYELHTGSAFHNPRQFKPERWLTPSSEMHSNWMPFGLGPRRCIGMNLALTELHYAVYALAKEDILRGAQCCKNEIEMLEWFNSKVVGGVIELQWSESI
jgi:cytochrome P450